MKKLLIFIFIGLFLISFTSAITWDNTAYYNLNEITGTNVEDSVGDNDGTNNGATTGVSGKINTAYDFENSDDDYLDVPEGLPDDLTNTAFTFNAWFKPEQVPTGLYAGYFFDFSGTERLEFRWANDTWGIFGTGVSLTHTETLTTGTWYMITVVLNSIKAELFIDGDSVKEQLGDFTTNFGGNATAHIGHNYAVSSGRGLDGFLDEVGIWERALTSDEILELYNNGDGLTYSQIDLNLISPEDNAKLIDNDVDFSANVTLTGSSLSIQNVSLLIDGIVNQTNSSGYNGIYNFQQTLPDGEYNWTIIAYDNESRQYSTSTRTFEIASLFEGGYDYESSVTESSQTTISGNFTIDTISSASLEYNNTNYSVSIDSLGNDLYTLSATITTPQVSSNTNISWNFWLNGMNATSNIQTITNINLDSCSLYSNVIVAYNLKNELTQEYINNSNSTIESLIYLRTLQGDNVAQFNQTFTGEYYVTICSEDNLSDSGLRLWEQSRYGSDDYVYEQHNVQNTSIEALSNFTLLDLPSDSATTFRILYKSSTFLPITDAVIDIQRKYMGEGAFKSVESPITDANGEVSASLDLDSVIYRMVIKKDGSTLATFENPAIVCQNILTGDCQINLNEKQSVDLINSFDTLNNLEYGLTQNNRTITFTFDVPNGLSRTIRMVVEQSTILGNESVYNQSLLATTGQLQCDIDNALGDVFVTIKIYADGNLITTATTIIQEDRSEYFGSNNIILTFFLVLSLILLMVSEPIAVLVGIIIGLVSSSLMLFINSGSLFGTTSVLLYIIIVVVLLIIKISKRQR